MEILRYLTPSGEDVIGGWFSRFRDARTRAKIETRFARLATGNFGDCEALKGGLFELRIDWGPGYRVYYSMVGRITVLLLAGGDKGTQNADIKRALKYLSDYRKRSEEHEKA